jgi:hypothetical protein
LYTIGVFQPELARIAFNKKNVFAVGWRLATYQDRK